MKGAAPLVEPLALDAPLRARLEALPGRANGAAVAAAPADRVPRQAKTGVLPAGNGERPPHYWTWRVFAAGFSAAECTSIRGLGREVLVEHLLAAAHEGRRVEPAWILAPDKLDVLSQGFAEAATRGQAAFLAAVSAEVAPAEAELFWLLQPIDQIENRRAAW
jgi:hypothetical protein